MAPETPDTPLRVAVIVGSTRPGRRADTVARWVLEHASRRPALKPELVDLLDYDLPLLDEPVPPMAGDYRQPHTRAWAEAIASFDAYIFVTPEYNRSIPGALKNAIDFLYAEWNDKAAGFVSYGAEAAGARAIDQLRVVMGELRVADVRANVLLSLFDDFTESTVTARPRPAQQLDAMLDQLTAWAQALRTVRDPVPA